MCYYSLKHLVNDLNNKNKTERIFCFFAFCFFGNESLLLRHSLRAGLASQTTKMEYYFCAGTPACK